MVLVLYIYTAPQFLVDLAYRVDQSSLAVLYR